MKKRKFTAMLMSVILIFSMTASVYSETLVRDEEMQNEVITQTEILPSEEGKEQVKIISEVEELRGEFEKHFLLENGEYMAVTYNSPVNYQDANGNWKTIDNTLEAKEVDGIEIFKNKDGILDVTFAKNGSSDNLVTVAKGDYSISWNITSVKSVDVVLPVEPQPDVEVADIEAPINPESEIEVPTEGESAVAEPSPLISAQTELTEETESVPETEISEKTEVISTEETQETEAEQTEIIAEPQKIETAIKETAQGEILTFEQSEYEPPNKTISSLVYSNAFEDDIDVKYTVNATAVKEDIILSSPKDITEYNMYLSLSGLTATLNGDNSISFTNLSGAEIFTMPAAYMYDSSGAESEDIAVTLTNLGENEYLLKLIPDAAWINAEDRVYPITIDPTVSYYSYEVNMIDKIISNSASITQQYADDEEVCVGDYSGLYFYTMIKMEEPINLPEGASVSSAMLRLISLERSSSTVSIGAYAYMHYWEELPDWDTVDAANKAYLSNSTGATYYYDGTAVHLYDFNITSLVAGSKGPQGFSLANGILLKRYSDSGYVGFCSSRYEFEIARPTISITYSLVGTAMYSGTYKFTSDLVSEASIVRDCYLIKEGNYWLIRNRNYPNLYTCAKDSTSIETVSLTSDAAIDAQGDYALWSIAVAGNNKFMICSKKYSGKAITIKSGVTTLMDSSDFCLATADDENEMQQFDLELQESSYTFAPALTASDLVITSEWGYRAYDGGSGYHYGIDISVGGGHNVYAVADGIVEEATFHKDAGYYVRIKHFGMTNGNGECYQTRYLHLQSYSVSKGDVVEQGQIIGKSGNTGIAGTYHLHFEVINGANTKENSINPAVEYHYADKRYLQNNCNPVYSIGAEISVNIGTDKIDYHFSFDANPNFIFKFDDDFDTDGYQQFYGAYSCPVSNDIGYTGNGKNNSSTYWRD